MFGRKKKPGSGEPDVGADGYDQDVLDEDGADWDDESGVDPTDAALAADAGVGRVGPQDVTEAHDDVARIDFGAIRIPALEGVGIDLQADPNGTLFAVTVMLGSSAVQLVAFAAARREGLWDEVRRELRTNIGGSGGLVDELEGPYGFELRANVPVQTPEGKSVMQPTRFLGFDGPRWLLRASVQGQGAGAEGDPAVDSLLDGVVVSRGSEAMAPGEVLTLRLPTDAQPVANLPGGRPPLDPFQRGPEITEVR